MAAEFSAEDFARFQASLLELREKNYQLEDKLKKQTKEHGILAEQCARQAAAIRASKKASEADAISRDNEVLRTRLRDQEEEFKLQHNTLLQELSRLVSDNERLEKQLSDLCNGAVSDEVTEASTDDSKQALRLRTELSLQEVRFAKKEEEHQKQIDALRNKLSFLTLQNGELKCLLEQHSVLSDAGSINLAEDGGVSFKKLFVENESAENDNDTSSDTAVNDDKLSELSVDLQDLQNRLDALQNGAKCREDDLLSQLDQCRLATSELSKSLETCHQQLNDSSQQIDHLKRQLVDGQQVVTDVRKELEQQQADNFEKIANLQEEWKSRVQSLEAALGSKESECSELQQKLLLMTTARNELDSQVVLLRETENAQQVMIQRMKDHLSEEEKHHGEQVKELGKKMEEQLDEHRHQRDLLQSQVASLEQKGRDAVEAQKAAEQARREKLMSDEQVEQLQDEVASLKEYWEVEKEKIQAEELIKLKHVETLLTKEKETMNTKLEIMGIQKQELEDKVQGLLKQVSDAQEERVIYERRGLALLKDVKKQLSSERRRADRLQEKLSQLLSDPALITSAAAGAPSEPGDDVSSVSSWSMVSGEQRQQESCGSAPQSPKSSSSTASCPSETAELVTRVASLQTAVWQRDEQILHLETSAAAMAQDLIAKATIIQNYCLNASPSAHRTYGSASSASESTPPSSPASTGAASVRRVLSRLREVGGEVASLTGPKEESSKEINRRLQALLEETLLKNINLQHDVDNLSKQVQELSAIAAKAVTSVRPSGDKDTVACLRESKSLSADITGSDVLADEGSSMLSDIVEVNNINVEVHDIMFNDDEFSEHEEIDMTDVMRGTC